MPRGLAVFFCIHGRNLSGFIWIRQRKTARDQPAGGTKSDYLSRKSSTRLDFPAVRSSVRGETSVILHSMPTTRFSTRRKSCSMAFSLRQSSVKLSLIHISVPLCPGEQPGLKPEAYGRRLPGPSRRNRRCREQSNGTPHNFPRSYLPAPTLWGSSVFPGPVSYTHLGFRDFLRQRLSQRPAQFLPAAPALQQRLRAPGPESCLSYGAQSYPNAAKLSPRGKLLSLIHI